MHSVWVKRHSSSTWVDIKVGYELCIKSSWAGVLPRSSNELGGWMKVEGRQSINVVHDVYHDDGAPTDVIVLIHKERLDIEMPRAPGTGKRA